ncbi:MAG: SDR family NAD(P)-dependent oxidoreductase, partial [Candidatus Delongbacteria bacterium]|nr:SDR family NAD(P)-dependent oxidoreductase [Candidatus Delongbacteria bacterium]
MKLHFCGDKYGIRTYCVYGDLSEESEVKAIVRQVKEFGINIDILINNAGIQTAYHENIWEHSRNEWLKSYKINVIAM